MCLLLSLLFGSGASDRETERERREREEWLEEEYDELKRYLKNPGDYRESSENYGYRIYVRGGYVNTVNRSGESDSAQRNLYPPIGMFGVGF